MEEDGDEEEDEGEEEDEEAEGGRRLSVKACRSGISSESAASVPKREKKGIKGRLRPVDFLSLRLVLVREEPSNHSFERMS